MNLNSPKIKKVFVVGIKGVGTAPVAAMLSKTGKLVSGSDTNEPQITDSLLAEAAIEVSVFDAANITDDIDLVIYSGAYKLDAHPELLAAKEKSIPCIPQAEALASILNQKEDLICVCGVGGKTTTSAMGASIHATAQKGGWFVGVSDVNKELAPAFTDDSSLFIAESDEYAIAPPIDTRPKFALYNPKIIICTNILYDHPDIYPSFEKTLEVFAEFFNTLPQDGLLLIRHKDLERVKSLLTTKATIQTYGSEITSDWQLIEGLSSTWRGIYKNTTVDFSLQVPGEMNGLNALSLIAAHVHLKLLVLDHVVQGLAEYAGTKRRLEVIKNHGDILYMDDYGHHPLEVELTLSALKAKYPHKRLIVAFHPHTLSRTKSLLKEFGQAFGLADMILIPDIFASARELDDGSITSQNVVDEINKASSKASYLPTFDEIIQFIKKHRQPGDIILTMGAGNIYQIHKEL
jgi:UDP-N-acetylmuramate--alanine ligase